MIYFFVSFPCTFEIEILYVNFWLKNNSQVCSNNQFKCVLKKFEENMIPTLHNLLGL